MLITDLEQQLAGPGAAEQQQSLLQRLRDVELRLRSELVQGLPPETFRQVVACADACAAAHDVIHDYKHDDRR